MGRILFFVALGLLGWWLFKSWQRKQEEPDEVEHSKRTGLKDHSEQSVLPCKHCGAYSPLDVGVMLEGRFYCNLEHARANGEKVK
ncbi:MAG: PP0621 family protein [Limnobacter sp.]|nr:PP0621 family protein [Limnobacter sp.]